MTDPKIQRLGPCRQSFCFASGFPRHPAEEAESFRGQCNACARMSVVCWLGIMWERIEQSGNADGQSQAVTPGQFIDTDRLTVLCLIRIGQYLSEDHIRLLKLGQVGPEPVRTHLAVGIGCKQKTWATRDAKGRFHSQLTDAPQLINLVIQMQVEDKTRDIARSQDRAANEGSVVRTVADEEDHACPLLDAFERIGKGVQAGSNPVLLVPRRQDDGCVPADLRAERRNPPEVR